MDEKAQKEALKELNEGLEETRKKKRKIKIIVVVIYAILFFVHQFFLGTINGEIPDFIGFKLINIPSVELKEKYSIKINGSNNLKYHISKQFRFPLIPFIIDIVDGRENIVLGLDNMVIDADSKVILNTRVFNCYSNYAGKRVNETCNKNSKYEQTNKIKNKLKIVKSEFPRDEVVYDGKIIEDVSEYLKSEGKYKIYLYNKKLFTTTNVKFEIEVKNEEVKNDEEV